MIPDVKKIVKKEDSALVFNAKGRLCKLTNEEFAVFERYAHRELFPANAGAVEKMMLESLCDLELIAFLDYAPKPVKKPYSMQLYHASSPEPLQEAPFLAHLAITATCNMHCTYCSVRKSHSQGGKHELSTDQWKTIIRDLSQEGVFQIGFTGGEPTLRPDLLELIQFTEDQGCVCNITTNGWAMTERFTEKLASTGIRQCQISLDSYRPETHDVLRGDRSFSHVMDAIALLQKNQIHVGIDCVVTRNNISDIPQLIRHCEEKKIEYLTLIKLKKGGLEETVFRSLVPSYEAYGSLIESLCYRKNEMPNVTIDCASISNLQYTLRDTELEEIPTAGCPVGHNLICISPVGDIYPCAALMEPEFKIGNMLTDDFSEIWKSHPLLCSLRDIKRTVSGDCSSCERLDFCRGGCRGIAYTLGKDIYAHDESCGFMEVNHGRSAH